jgi:hypothetical protein
MRELKHDLAIIIMMVWKTSRTLIKNLNCLGLAKIE